MDKARIFQLIRDEAARIERNSKNDDANLIELEAAEFHENNDQRHHETKSGYHPKFPGASRHKGPHFTVESENFDGHSDKYIKETVPMPEPDQDMEIGSGMASLREIERVEKDIEENEELKLEKEAKEEAELMKAIETEEREELKAAVEEAELKVLERLSLIHKKHIQESKVEDIQSVKVESVKVGNVERLESVFSHMKSPSRALSSDFPRSRQYIHQSYTLDRTSPSHSNDLIIWILMSCIFILVMLVILSFFMPSLKLKLKLLYRNTCKYKNKSSTSSILPLSNKRRNYGD